MIVCIFIGEIAPYRRTGKDERLKKLKKCSYVPCLYMENKQKMSSTSTDLLTKNQLKSIKIRFFNDKKIE